MGRGRRLKVTVTQSFITVMGTSLSINIKTEFRRSVFLNHSLCFNNYEKQIMAELVGLQWLLTGGGIDIIDHSH